MRGVARDEHALRAKTRRAEEVLRPLVHRESLELERHAHRPREDLRHWPALPCFAQLVDVFGPEAAGKGRLRTKYIAPIHEDQIVIACARVRGRREDGDRATVYELDLWCEDDRGLKLTVGDAIVRSTQR